VSPLVLGNILSVEYWSLPCFDTAEEMSPWTWEDFLRQLPWKESISSEDRGAYSIHGKNEQLCYF